MVIQQTAQSIHHLIIDSSLGVLHIASVGYEAPMDSSSVLASYMRCLKCHSERVVTKHTSTVSSSPREGAGVSAGVDPRPVITPPVTKTNTTGDAVTDHYSDHVGV